MHSLIKWRTRPPRAVDTTNLQSNKSWKPRTETSLREYLVQLPYSMHSSLRYLIPLTSHLLGTCYIQVTVSREFKNRNAHPCLQGDCHQVGEMRHLHKWSPKANCWRDLHSSFCGVKGKSGPSCRRSRKEVTLEMGLEESYEENPSQYRGRRKSQVEESSIHRDGK